MEGAPSSLDSLSGLIKVFRALATERRSFKFASGMAAGFYVYLSFQDARTCSAISSLLWLSAILSSRSPSTTAK